MCQQIRYVGRVPVFAVCAAVQKKTGCSHTASALPQIQKKAKINTQTRLRIEPSPTDYIVITLHKNV